MKILFITGYSKQAETPNLLCMENVIDACKKLKNMEVSVAGAIIDSELFDANWKKNPIAAFLRILHWPAQDYMTIKKIYKDIVRAAKNVKYDAIVAFCNPYEAVHASYLFKKRNRETLFILYEIEPINRYINSVAGHLGIGRFLNLLTLNAERKIYQRADGIIHMKSCIHEYEQARYKKYNKKFSYVDLPLITNKCVQHKYEREDSTEITMMFSGRLNSVYRSPEYFLKLLELCELDIKMKFYTKGDCEPFIQGTTKIKTECHGYIDRELLLCEMEKSDYLVNIGNRFSNLVPSKLFEYIMQKKPIIHIASRDDDPCINYLKRYGGCVIINENAPIEENIVKLRNFINNTKVKDLSDLHIYELFRENTPEYSAHCIKKMIAAKVS